MEYTLSTGTRKRGGGRRRSREFHLGRAGTSWRHIERLQGVLLDLGRLRPGAPHRADAILQRVHDEITAELRWWQAKRADSLRRADRPE